MKYRQVVDMEKKKMKARKERLETRSSRLQFIVSIPACSPLRRDRSHTKRLGYKVLGLTAINVSGGLAEVSSINADAANASAASRPAVRREKFPDGGAEGSRRVGIRRPARAY